MQQAEDIRFLAVSGTITIGASRARYDFTLVEYHLHIDEVPWIIFSTLDNALGLEFTAEFWEIVQLQKERTMGISRSAVDRRQTGLRCRCTLPGSPHVHFQQPSPHHKSCKAFHRRKFRSQTSDNMDR